MAARTQAATAAAAETERIVCWLRLAAIALIGIGQGVLDASATEEGFLAAILAYSAWGVAAAAWVSLRGVTTSFALVSTAVDVVAISALVSLSGGAFSEARTAYFIIPIAVAFRFRPLFTAVASAATVIAYVVQSYASAAPSPDDVDRFVAVHAGYLAWVGVASVLLSYVLARRTRRAAELAEARRRLMAEALTSEERERRGLAEGLHDHAIQNLLSARHDLEEVAEEAPHPGLRRADDAIAETVEELRDAVFELHPFVLEQAGLQAALRAVAQRASRQGGFELHLDLNDSARHGQDPLLFATARELLANVVRHAGARNVWMRLGQDGRMVRLTVRDDGRGFDPAILQAQLAAGHIGLTSQRERVTSIGGSFEIRAAPGRGTAVDVRVPAAADLAP